MQRPSLFLFTLVTVLLTAVVLQTGRLQPNSSRAASRRHDVQAGTAHARDASTSEAASRYRRCQASHWRAYMLQH